MATIAPGRLHNVSNAADFIALTETNFEELADDVRALSALVHALRGALVVVGVVKGGA
jgi:hypothetical protein